MHGRDVGVGALFKTVLQRGGASVAPAPEDADIGTVAADADNGAGEDAVADGGGRRLAVTDESACIVGAGVDGGLDGATLNEVGAVGKAYETGQVALAGGYGARHGEILDGGTADAVEGGRALIVAVDGGSDGVIIAKEGAAEGMAVVGTHHPHDIDVGHQLHVLAAVTVAVKHVFHQPIPVGCMIDEPGVFFCARTGKRCLPCYVRHDFPTADVAGSGCLPRILKYKLFAFNEGDAR